jgi:RNA polymerase sigma-70 factor (ECF subfamily)
MSALNQTPGGKTVQELDLVRRAKAGSREAFGQLVFRYQLPVYRVVRGILNDPSASEDVAQEVFLKAFAGLARFRGEAGIFTWLYRIAVNEALRARKQRGFVDLDAVAEVEAPAPEPDAEPAPTLATLEALLKKLPDDYRAIVVLRDLEGLSYAEISETLEIPLGTVESRLFRARQELRTLWRKSKEKNHAL